MTRTMCLSADVLTLTVAEHEALDAEDTTIEAVDDRVIKDSAENIMAEIELATWIVNCRWRSIRPATMRTWCLTRYAGE